MLDPAIGKVLEPQRQVMLALRTEVEAQRQVVAEIEAGGEAPVVGAVDPAHQREADAGLREPRRAAASGPVAEYRDQADLAQP